MSKFLKFSIISLFILVVLLVSVFFCSLTLPSEQRVLLAQSSEISAGLVGIASIFVAMSALSAQMQAENIKKKSSDELWISKQRLEESIHMYIVMLQTELRTLGSDKVNSSTPIHNQALKNLRDALSNAREAGLYRALVAIGEKKKTAHNVGYEMPIIEAHINHDLATNREGVGSGTLEISDLFEYLQEIREEEIKHVTARLPQEPVQKLRNALSGN